jgi:hypothetical protein
MSGSWGLFPVGKGGGQAAQGVAVVSERGAHLLRPRRVDDDRAGLGVLRKLSMVTSKCTIARFTPSAVGTRVALAITHSSVSGDIYGFA